jgi:arylformamidase
MSKLAGNPVVEVIDLSHEVSEGMANIAGWTTAFPVIDTIAKTKTLSQGKVGYSAKMILMAEHNGTHLDVPRHFVEDGLAVDQIPLSNLILPGHLLDLTHKKVGEPITIDDLEAAEDKSGKRVGPGTAVICWTGVDKVWGQPNMNRIRPYVPAEAAQWMVSRKISLFATHLIGMDSPTSGGTPHILSGWQTACAWSSSSATLISSSARLSCSSPSRSRWLVALAVLCERQRW